MRMIVRLGIIVERVSGSESAGKHALSRQYPRNGVIITESAIDFEDVAKDGY